MSVCFFHDNRFCICFCEYFTISTFKEIKFFVKMCQKAL
nr:MAG TPA: hypothetical protein [Caudoviricetes sp.]